MVMRPKRSHFVTYPLAPNYRSARIEALPQLSVCLSLGITVVSFDFSGSGLSHGHYNLVSVGYTTFMLR